MVKERTRRIYLSVVKKVSYRKQLFYNRGYMSLDNPTRKDFVNSLKKTTHFKINKIHKKEQSTSGSSSDILDMRFLLKLREIREANAAFSRNRVPFEILFALKSNYK